MNKLRLLALSLCALMALAPAADGARGKKKRPKVEPRYKISVNYESNATEIGDCKSITNGSMYRIKTTTTTTTKYSETGYFPGSSRRLGYRQNTLKVESTDPYVPSDEQTLSKTPIEMTYGPDQWDLERKGRNIVYAWEDAGGDIEDVPFRAPGVGKSVTKTLSSTYRPERESTDRCDNSAEWTNNETVTIRRTQ